jgi:hypothetical protein
MLKAWLSPEPSSWKIKAEGTFMKFIAILPGKSRSARILAAALFFACVALQSGLAADAASITPETANAAPKHKVKSQISTRPFSHIAVGANFGTQGAGLEVATTLARKFNLRADATFFDYALSTSQNGINYNGTLNMRDARASLDFFPFGGGFRISGGMAAYNKVSLGATALVVQGQSITLNDTDYYSDPSNPLTGAGSFGYSRKFAPTATFGWGNIIPRSGRHLAFPVEIGAAFTGTPTVNINFAGSACTDTTYTECGNVQTFDGFATNLAAQQKKLVNDVAPFRVYPIINFGVTYRIF